MWTLGVCTAPCISMYRLAGSLLIVLARTPSPSLCCAQDSLGGDAKALMFCNLAPQPLHVSETLSSLAFASKVSSVVLKTPTRRVEEARADELAAGAGVVVPGEGEAGGANGYTTPQTAPRSTPRGYGRSASSTVRAHDWQ
jgi:hypothetical protein